MIITQYELTKDIYQSNRNLINNIIQKSKFPSTFKVLLNFYHKIEDIKKGLENLKNEKVF